MRIVHAVARHRISVPAPSVAIRVAVLVLALMVSTLVVVTFGLREFSHSDYEQQLWPAMQSLVAGDVRGFMSQLPRYGGAALLQAPFGYAGGQFGGDVDLWSFRAQAIPGVLAMGAMGLVAGNRVAVHHGGLRGLAFGSVSATFVAGFPLAILAHQAGHLEQLTVAALVLFGVLAARSGHPVLAGLLIGVAAGSKSWACLAVPVALVLMVGGRQVVAYAIACAVGLVLILSPNVAFNGFGLNANGGSGGLAVGSGWGANAGSGKPIQVFWFFGEKNPEWSADKKVFEADGRDWDQRISPAWTVPASRASILLVGGLLTFGFWLAKRRGRGRPAREDVFLLLSAVLWWRCLLDVGNFHYYALPSLAALAVWQALRGRPPVAAIAITAALWVALRQVPGIEPPTPDWGAVAYLSWAVPVGGVLALAVVAPETAARGTERLRMLLPNLFTLVGNPGVYRDAPGTVPSQEALALVPPAPAQHTRGAKLA